MKMKRSVISIALTLLLTAAVGVLSTGCDLVRASLGKPTSADLELLRLAEQVRAESAGKDPVSAPAVTATPAATPETPASPDTVKASEAAPAPAPRQVYETIPDGIKKYYVVVGAFKEEAGLNYYVKEVESKGFSTILLPFKSGTTVVCLEGTDDIEKARAQMKTVRAAGIDAWLYSSNQKLHKAQ
jgi:cell division septation protein DedD